MQVVTGWNPEGYEKYGKNFDQTFAKYWPNTVDLAAYIEQWCPLKRGVTRDLFQCYGLRDFLDESAKIPERCGRAPCDGWKSKDIKKGYSFRFDAVKFSRQCFIPEHAISQLDDDTIMCWLDADVVTFAHVPEYFLEDMVGGADLVYLGREGRHSEIGFWAVRVNENTRRFCHDLAEMFRTGRVFKLREWHSAYVFDHVRKGSELVQRDLTCGATIDHVWWESPLCKYMDHLKGEWRKDVGHSAQRVRA